MSGYANEVIANLIVERHLVAPILDADIGRIHIRSWGKLVTDGIPSDKIPSNINLRTGNRLKSRPMYIVK